MTTPSQSCGRAPLVRLAQDRLHPLQPQLRDRGPARRPAPRPGARRQGSPRLRGLHLREARPPRPLPERPPPPDDAAAPPARRQLRGDRLGHRDPRGRRGASSAFATRTAATRSSTTAAAGRETTCPAPTRARRARRSVRVYAANALAQEKTGEFWVDGQLFGAPVVPHRARLRARRGRGLHRQEPVAVARLPARARRAARDREGSRSARWS